MRRATASVGSLLLAGLAGLAWGAAAAAAADVTTGSWTQLRVSQGTPDLQSSDGHALPVANTVLGPVAVAALRFPGGATTLELTRVDPAASVPTAALPALPVPSPVVWACPATGPWKAGDRQPWGDRPAYDCLRHSVGAVTAGGMYWDLTGIADTAVDLVLVPGDSTPFDLSFAAPSAASFQPVDPVLPPVDPPASLPADDPPAETTGTVEPPALPDVPVVAETAPAPQAPVALAPQPPYVEHPVAIRPVAATSAPRWVGPGLLAFLAFLLMLKAALPVSAGGAPRALVAVRPDREST